MKVQDRINAARLYRRGVAALDRGDFAEAVRLLAAAAEQPGVAGTLATYYLGRAHLQTGLRLMHEARYAEASGHLRQAHRLNPHASDLGDYLARCYAVQGQYDLAAEAFERARATAADQETSAIRSALAQWRAGRPVGAMLTLAEYIDRRPQEAEPRFQLALMRAATDDVDGAVDLLEQAIRLAPRHVEAHRHLGLTLAVAGRVEQAARVLSAAQRLRPGDAGLALELNLALQSCGTERSANLRIVEGEDAFGIDERSEGRPAAGGPAAWLAERVAGDPELVEAFLDLPATGRDREIFPVLDAALAAAVQRHSGYADLHHFRARVRARLGRLEEAVEAEAEALAINPRYVQATLHTARLLVALGRYDEAVARFERAIGLGSDYADVHFELGELHRRAGRRDAACASYQSALRINGGYVAARGALDALAAA